MSTTAIVPINKLDISKVSFSNVRTNKQGGKSVVINYSGQQLQMLVNKLAFPAGILLKTNERSGQTDYSLIGSLKGCDPYAKEVSSETTDVAMLYNFLLTLQESIIKHVTDNSAAWFGKKRSEESIRDSMKSLLRTSVDKVNGEYVPNGKYPPSWTLKVPVYDGRISMDVIDRAKKPVYLTVDSLTSVFTKGIEANVVVTPSIYIINQGFGVTWRLSYAQTLANPRLSAASVFTSEEEDLPEPESSQVAPTPQEEEEDAPPAQEVVSAPVSASGRGKRRAAVVPT